MRSLAMAEAFQQRHAKVHFAYQQHTRENLENLNNRDISCHKIECVKDCLLTSTPIHALFLDDYQLSSADLMGLSQAGVPIILRDDMVNQQKLVADCVINPSDTATPSSYLKRGICAQRLCLGPAYTTLRHEFTTTKGLPYEQRQQLLITFGGTDPTRATLPVVKSALEVLNDTTTIIVLLRSSDHPDYGDIQRLSKLHANLTVDVDCQQIASRMASSALAITAGGGTLGELAAMGVPSLVCVVTDNQQQALVSKYNGIWFHAIDWRNVGTMNESRRLLKSRLKSLWADKKLRQKMSSKAQSIVDTCGTNRIFDKVHALVTDKLGRNNTMSSE
jgi:UDP-2,4-diacetamido-2,4,6-trideoxy-beta-L-altropyranose hydrolase